MYDQYDKKSPNFYAIAGNFLLLIWSEYDAIYDVNLISAYATETTPLKFYTHKPSTHAGTYLFRKGNQRIYRSDIHPFPSEWAGENTPVNLAKVKENYPYIKPFKQKP